MNPYLPLNEYIPDGEPRVFGDRIYIYGSHDIAGSDVFCDIRLKCWSAPVSDPTNWTCHGDIFTVQATPDYPADTDWTGERNRLFAPDVVEKNGKYYLYAYIVNAPGCVAVADSPIGPFKVLSQYKSNIPDSVTCNGWYIDPGVLVDDDGRSYIYCGFQRSFMAEIEDDMFTMKDGSLIEHIIPIEPDTEHGFDEDGKLFFEACSPRKVGDTYYMIYSPKHCSRLAYATSKSPTGPFEYRGYIVDNGVDYRGGNDHGSIMNVGGQWYIFYHRMTNGSIFSRRGCVEKIEILPDGTIPPVEMTSLGFEDSLNPYRATPADIACVLSQHAMISEKNPFERLIVGIKHDTLIGYKYFDFAEDVRSKTMEVFLHTEGFGHHAEVDVIIDSPEGEVLGTVNVGMDSGAYSARIKAVTGRHAVFFKVRSAAKGEFAEAFKDRELFGFKGFVFVK